MCRTHIRDIIALHRLVAVVRGGQFNQRSNVRGLDPIEQRAERRHRKLAEPIIVHEETLGGVSK